MLNSMDTLSIDFQQGYDLGFMVGFGVACIGVPLFIMFLMHVSDAIRNHLRG